MRTRPAGLPTDRLKAFERALQRPHTWHITGVEAFWLEAGDGRRLSDEFADTGPAYDCVLALVRTGFPAEDIVLVGRTASRPRSVLGQGVDLLDVAEAHAGIPARPRVPRE